MGGVQRTRERRRKSEQRLEAGKEQNGECENREKIMGDMRNQYQKV